MIDHNSNERNEQIKYWLEQMEDGSTKSYIEKRIINQMNWYSDKSKTCKKRFMVLSILAIVLTAMVPIFSIVADGNTAIKIIIAMLSSGVTVLNTCLALNNDKQLWYNYRKNRELLQSTLYKYFSNAGMFLNKTNRAEKDAELISLCETILMDEVRDWNGTSERKQ